MYCAETSLETKSVIAPAGEKAKRRLEALVWVLAPIACHIGYSWIGFNPTDDGWLQAVARRLAEGEVPHRDFIFVRPALSALFQVPIVLLGGDYVIWLSRLWGWLTLGAVCWMWTGMLLRDVSLLSRYVYYVVATLLCAHTFPVMAWHTIDGMVLCTLAVAILAHDTPSRRKIAFFIAGTAILCRQNFVFFPPLLLLAVGGKPQSWVVAGAWSALPSLLYIGGIAVLGGAADFFQQFFSTRGTLGAVAFDRYARDNHFWLGTASGAVLALGLLATRGKAALVVRWVPTFAFLLIALWMSFSLWKGPGYYFANTSVLFGAVAGLTVVLIFRSNSTTDRFLCISALGLAWVAGISIGYNSPALMSGVLLLVVFRQLQVCTHLPTYSSAATPLALLAAIAVGAAFTSARHKYPYRDRPAHELQYEAGSALKGASGLRTNALTFATLLDLRKLTDRVKAEGHQYAVLTDCAAIWMVDKGRNPLPCEWPQETELGYNVALFRRIFNSIAKTPEGSVVIVQKFLISEYSWGQLAVPNNSSYYFAQNWIAANSQKISETPFFNVYSSRLPPTADR